jgi:hypothetical protein
MAEDKGRSGQDPTKTGFAARPPIIAWWHWLIFGCAVLIGLAEYTGFQSKLTVGKGGFMAATMLALIAVGWLIWPTSTGRAGSGLPGESEQMRDTRWTRDGVLVFFYVGCWGVLLCGFQFLAHEEGSARVAFGVLGAAAVTACAASVVGTLLGFLFAIPRAQSKDSRESTSAEPAVADGAASATSKTSKSVLGVNTNLEEISDWLTKIIVGMGLVNLEKIPAQLRGLGVYFGASFGDIPGRESLALALLLLFGTSGFLMGYLLTRLYLAGAFSRALSPGEVLAQALSLSGGTDAPPTSVIRKVESAAAQATPAEVQDQVRKLALEYQFTRSTMLFTPERTSRLDGIVLRMKGLAASAADMTEQLMGSISEGERLAAIAFLHMRPDPRRVAWLGARFKDETPFIKYHAAHALRRLLDVPLTVEQKTELRAAVESARNNIDPTDAAALAPISQTLQRLDATK